VRGGLRSFTRAPREGRRMNGASAVTYLEAIRMALWEEMERDPRVFLLGEDVGHYGGAFRATAGMLERFGPGRIIDTPISEAAVGGAGTGAPLVGLRSVVAMQFLAFIANAWNMIVIFARPGHYRLGQAVPIVIRGPAGGNVHGSVFHSQNPEGYFQHTPGLKIVAPATAADAKGLLTAAIRDPNPVLYFEHKYLYRRIKEELPAGDYEVPIGQARLARPGRDLSVVTWGAMLHVALEAAGRLEADGIDLEVLDLRTL